jgi:hemoglobin-like flavoprotein
MDGRQIQLVQHSFARAARLGPHVAATFYKELFAIDPSLRPLFKADMIVMGRKLMDMLGYIVSGLDAPETILPEVRDLAVRHIAYGVEAHHYATAGMALLRTLRHELGGEFTTETRAAWAAAYQLVADTMREAAYGAAGSRSI